MPVVMGTLLVLIAATTDHWQLLAWIGAVYVVINSVLSVMIRRRLGAGESPTWLVGPVRAAFNVVMVPMLVWAGSPALPVWIVAIPPLLVLPFVLANGGTSMTQDGSWGEASDETNFAGIDLAARPPYLYGSVMQVYLQDGNYNFLTWRYRPAE